MIRIDKQLLDQVAEKARQAPRRRMNHTFHQVPERSEEHTSELQSRQYLVCRLLLENKHLISSPTNRKKIAIRPSLMMRWGVSGPWPRDNSGQIGRCRRR